MKLSSILSSVFALVIFVGITSAADNTPADESAIQQAVTDYVASIDSRNVGEFEKVVSDEAAFIGYSNFSDKVTYSNASQMLDNLKNNRIGGWKRNVEVSNVDMSGKTAMAKIVITDARLKQIEYVSLIKYKEGWKIASSTFVIEKNS